MFASVTTFLKSAIASASGTPIRPMPVSMTKLIATAVPSAPALRYAAKPFDRFQHKIDTRWSSMMDRTGPRGLGYRNMRLPEVNWFKRLGVGHFTDLIARQHRQFPGGRVCQYGRRKLR